MPSVEMRKTTTVFGVRVLRSGRRLRIPSEGKRLRAAERWIEFLGCARDGNCGYASQCKAKGRRTNNVHRIQESSGIILNTGVDCTVVMPELDKHEPQGISGNGNVDKMWGAFYTRKRKRTHSQSLGMIDNGVNNNLLFRRFGKQYARKRYKKGNRGSSAHDSWAHHLTIVESISVENCRHASSVLVAGFLSSVLCYMRRTSVTLQHLFAFLQTNPIHDVYSLHGVNFFEESTSEMRLNACIISSVRVTMPVFTVNLSVVPSCFMSLHASLHLKRSDSLSSVCWNLALDVSEGDTRIAMDMENECCDASGSDRLGRIEIPYSIDSGMWVLAQPVPTVTKVATRNFPPRNGQTNQKQRNTLRSRRGQFTAAHYALITSYANYPEYIPNANAGEAKSASVNLLVIELDKCYREASAMITLECSVSKQWILVVKRGGLSRLHLFAEKVLRPCSSNRVTHAIVWSVDDNLKMEFPDRQDWMIFKELYKECCDRNMHHQATSSIPVPGIREVAVYEEKNVVPFIQPDSYISVKDDEATRALAWKRVNYDLDSDDEEWLATFNNNYCLEKELLDHVYAERFEFIIDSFEREAFSNPKYCADERSVCGAFLETERKEVVEAVYSYWSEKRKQKRSPLIRIFQLYQPRSRLIPMHIMRKKRSFKRHKGQFRRGKNLTLLQAVEGAQQKKSAFVKVQEAKEAAQKHDDKAVVKRHKAQQLMGNADLLTFKALMALRIAEAVKTAESLLANAGKRI
ncbi:hypothetical protein DM860_008993 [Cuscuta australis]|uniref:Enhancer of polycomb-like protein n=1 Tax=Cuscuta australis TaxID=267555 RepID=A0A328DBZ1_9ASTE|nr:hypothetical protein DM860_008993 [Cuscuta australis]